MIIDCHFTSCGHLLQRLGVSLGALFFCLMKKKKKCMALCYHKASTVSYLIRITHPSDRTPEIQKYQNTDMVSLQTSILSLYLGYFYISDWLLYWLLHWHLYIWNVLFFSKARVLRNNATHSLQMFMLFRTNYIYFCLLFNICIVPRLLENVILLSPLIKWHYSKSYSWCLGSFCMLWTGSKGSWSPNLVYLITEVEKVVFSSHFLRIMCHKMNPVRFYFQEVRKKNCTF